MAAASEKLKSLASKVASAAQTAVNDNSWAYVPLGRSSNGSLAENFKSIFKAFIGPGLVRRLTYVLISAVLALYLLLSSNTSHTSVSQTWNLNGIQGTDKKSLLNSINYNSTIIKNIESGQLFNLTEQQAAQSWRKPFTFNDPFAMNQVPLDNDRCPIYTYFDHANVTELKETLKGKRKESAEALEDQLIEAEIVETWARAMWSLGFKPIVLNVSDAEMHPHYKEFVTSNVMTSEIKKANLKWLAWLARGAGIYSDYRVIPVTRDINHEAIQMLKSCSYTERLAFDDSSLSLIVADIKDTKPFIFDIMRGFSEKELLVNFEVYSQDAFAYYSNRNFRTVTNSLMGGFKAKKLAANDDRIPPLEILTMMHTHLKQVFLDTYPGGFRTIGYGPLGGAALRLTSSLHKCPNTLYVNYCPPTRSVLHNMAYTKNGKQRKSIHTACKPLPCSQRGQNRFSVHSGQGLVEPSSTNFFTIASILHPYSNLVLNNKQAIVDQVRMDQRDSQVHDLTNSLIGSNVMSPELRLLALKDSMFQSSYQSHMAWILIDSFNEELFSALEWDIGLTLRFEAILISIREKTEIKLKMDASTDLLQPDLIKDISSRINNDLYASDYLERAAGVEPHEDAFFDALKAWNTADYEIWRFLYKLRANKLVSRQIVQRQYSNYATSDPTDE